jgi:flagellar motor switch protein FliM
MLLPYATIEPIREHLLQSFMGEKFGRDPVWEGHLATEIWQARIDVDAILYESDIPLKSILDLKVGDVLPIEVRPDGLVSVRCGDIVLSEGRMGKVGDHVAVRLARPLKKSRTTMAIFDMADAVRKES